MFQHARTYLTLARWLGPWTSDLARPSSVARRSVRVTSRRRPALPSGEFSCWLYAPRHRAPRGAYLIAPGLHYAGPADPRMDRLCRILAAAGFTVLAPFLPDYTSLRVAPSAFDDFRACCDALLRQPEMPEGVRPAVFSISFGSLLALHLAASASHRDRIGALVVFGGYLDWRDTITFCLTGEIDGCVHGARDPLNQPVVFMNLVDHLDGAPANPAPLLAAWRRQVEATWGRPELKTGDRRLRMARAEAASLPADMRALFLTGCGDGDGSRAVTLCTEALARSANTDFLDPRPYLPNIRCPVHLVHGVDDDVIPFVQSQRLAECLPHVPCALHLTGLYGHTTKSDGLRLADATKLASELASMTRILRAMTTAPTAR